LNPKKNLSEAAKRNAAKEAAKHVKDGHIVGLGSGSTAAYAIEEIARRMKKEKLRILGIPTSYEALTIAVRNKIPITTLEEHETIDLTIDGADQIDSKLNLIKGMGGALGREKIVAKASKTLVIVADEKKKVKFLGDNGQPVPIEVVPFAIPLVAKRIREIGGNPILREGKGKVGPVVTDNCNAIIDAIFGPLNQPAELEHILKGLTGVVETGLFIGMTDVAYIGKRVSFDKLVKQSKQNP
jgi:ribose 5-phosphate isomerase A